MKPKSGPTIEMLDPQILKARERNPRTHPPAQLEALAKSIREFGFTAPVLIDADNVLIAGHGRVAAAINAKLDAVPCVRVTHLSDAQVRAYVIADNRLAESAEWDKDLLGEELKALAEMDFDVSLVGFEVPEVELPKRGEEKNDGEDEAQPTGIFGYREDALLPSSNRWGVPDTRADMLFEGLPDDVWVSQPHEGKTWLYLHGSNKHPEGMKSIRAFYVDDYRFESVWTHAVSMLYSLKGIGHVALVEPDFSLWWEMPFSVQLYNVYRSRWCARYWQEAGFRVIPSLKWSGPASFEFSTAGLPPEIPVAAVQCRTLNNGKANDRFKAGLRHQLETVKVKTLLAYGGAQHKDLFEDLPCKVVLFPSWTQRRNDLRKIG